MRISLLSSLVLTVGLLLPTSHAVENSPKTSQTTNPALAGDGVEIGIAKHDGVTLSGGEALVTRNGITEKLRKELLLPTGMRVRPNGTVTLADQTDITLRATQLLTFEGKIVDLPEPAANPSGPRSAGTGGPVVHGQAVAGATGGAGVAGTNGANRSLPRERPQVAGSVFLGSDGVPFMGSMNADGTILRADGEVLPASSSLRAVSFAPDGSPSLGTVNANGTITRADGTIESADGSVRGLNGALLPLAAQNNSTAGGLPGTQQQNPNSQQQNAGNQQQNPMGQQQNSGNQQQNPVGAAHPNTNSPAGNNTNTPNNTGTLNRGNAGNGQSPNNPGTSNNNRAGSNAGSNQQGSTGGAARSGGAGSGDGRSGSGKAGGAGSAGGATGGGANSGGGITGGSGGAGGGAPK